MARPWIRIAAVTAGSVLAISMIPGTANAAVDGTKDRRGDAPRGADITKVQLRHGHQSTRGIITIKHRRIKKLAALELILKPRNDSAWRYIVSIKRDATGKVTSKTVGWQHGNATSTYSALPCTTIRTVWVGASTKITVPNSCLTKHDPHKRVRARARVIARIGAPHSTYDDITPTTRFLPRG